MHHVVSGVWGDYYHVQFGREYGTRGGGRGMGYGESYSNVEGGGRWDGIPREVGEGPVGWKTKRLGFAKRIGRDSPVEGLGQSLEPS